MAWSFARALPLDATADAILEALHAFFPDLDPTILEPMGDGHWAIHFDDPLARITSSLHANRFLFEGAVYDLEPVPDTPPVGLLRVDITGWWPYDRDDAAAQLEFQRLLDNVEVHIESLAPGALIPYKGFAEVRRFVQIVNPADPQLGTQYAQALIQLTEQRDGNHYLPHAQLRRETSSQQGSTHVDVLQLDLHTEEGAHVRWSE